MSLNSQAEEEVKSKLREKYDNCLALIQVNTELIIVHNLEIYCIKAFIQTLKIHISKKHFSLFDVFDRRISKDSENMKYYKAGRAE